MPTIAALTTFSANTQAKAAEVNANFSTIRTTVNTYGAFVDLAATITGAWTFTTSPSFPAAVTFGASVTITTGGLTISAGGFTVTGNSSVTGTLTATTFSGSGASLTNLPAGQLTGAFGAADGNALTNLNASALATGTVDKDRLPSTLNATTIDGISLADSSGTKVISSSSALHIIGAQLFGASGATPKLDMRPGSTYFLDGGTLSNLGNWDIDNSGTSYANSSWRAPTGLTTRTAANDRFLVIRSNNTNYYIRLERWSA